jgi:colanic acid/amylovoran biosynthesis protein
MTELFERLGLGRWVHDIETVTADCLINSVDQFLEMLPELRETLFTAVQREHASAVASGAIVKQAFEEWRNTRQT